MVKNRPYKIVFRCNDPFDNRLIVEVSVGYDPQQAAMSRYSELGKRIKRLARRTGNLGVRRPQMTVTFAGRR